MNPVADFDDARSAGQRPIAKARNRVKQPRGAAMGDLLLFIFFLIVLGVIWAMTGGPGRDISRTGPFLNLPFPLGSGTAYTVPTVPIPSTSQSTSGSGGGSATTNETLSDIIARLRGGGTKPASPHAPGVSLSSSNARNTDPKTEYITIKFSTDLEGQLAISNWRIESAVSALGTVLGPASYLPIGNTGPSEVPVSVGAGATVYLVTGRSPLGESFRKNLCTGYFTNSQTYTPSLTKECPRPDDELKRVVLAGFIPSDPCVNYVKTISTCQLINTAKVPVDVGDQCMNFIATTLTYNSCVNAHKNDVGFYKNEWYIYLDRDQELWKKENEHIRLLDETGKVIASVSY